MTAKIISTIRSGQVAAYRDSVYSYEVKIDGSPTDAEAWNACQSIKKARHRDDSAKHDGCCGFKFGLESFGSLKKTGDTWRYTVTYPYCD